MVRSWARALGLPIVAATLLGVVPAALGTTLPSDRPIAATWIPITLGLSYAWLAAWTGWRVVRKECCGLLGAALCGFVPLLACFLITPALLPLLPTKWTPAFARPDNPYPDLESSRAQILNAFSALMTLLATAPLLGWLGGLLARRTRIKQQEENV